MLEVRLLLRTLEARPPLGRVLFLLLFLGRLGLGRLGFSSCLCLSYALRLALMLCRRLGGRLGLCSLSLLGFGGFGFLIVTFRSCVPLVGNLGPWLVCALSALVMRARWEVGLYVVVFLFVLEASATRDRRWRRRG